MKGNVRVLQFLQPSVHSVQILECVLVLRLRALGPRETPTTDTLSWFQNAQSNPVGLQCNIGQEPGFLTLMLQPIDFPMLQIAELKFLVKGALSSDAPCTYCVRKGKFMGVFT